MADGIVSETVEGRRREVGGFPVRRVLPWAGGRMVGPFVFLDELGPVEFPPGGGLDVRPHPHIGLATVTWLIEGTLLHRDSLGSVQRIVPGEVNWMTAGRGIAHSERTPPEDRAGGGRLHAVQCWVALPREHEEAPPAFSNHAAASLPTARGPGWRLVLVLGGFRGQRSPVPSLADAFYAELTLEAGARFALEPGLAAERAVYVVAGSVALAGTEYEAGRLLLLRPGAAGELAARTDARVMLLGGAPADAKRHVWWNFVSSSEARIEEAKADWRAGRFAPVPGDDEFIPLPE